MLCLLCLPVAFAAVPSILLESQCLPHSAVVFVSFPAVMDSTISGQSIKGTGARPPKVPNVSLSKKKATLTC